MKKGRPTNFGSIRAFFFKIGLSCNYNVASCNLCAKVCQSVKGQKGLKIEENTFLGKLVKPFPIWYSCTTGSDLWAMAGKDCTVFDNNWPPSWIYTIQTKLVVELELALIERKQSRRFRHNSIKWQKDMKGSKTKHIPLLWGYVYERYLRCAKSLLPIIQSLHTYDKIMKLKRTPLPQDHIPHNFMYPFKKEKTTINKTQFLKSRLSIVYSKFWSRSGPQVLFFRFYSCGHNYMTHTPNPKYFCLTQPRSMYNNFCDAALWRSWQDGWSGVMSTWQWWREDDMKDDVPYDRSGYW